MTSFQWDFCYGMKQQIVWLAALKAEKHHLLSDFGGKLWDIWVNLQTD